MTVTILLLSFLILFGGPLRALDLPTREIEDDSYLRISLEDSWFRERPERVIAKPPEHYTLRGGGRVQVRVETSPRNREEFAVVLARGQGGAYPAWAQGSWSLIRRRDNNPQGSRIRVFLRSDYNTYLQFRPFSGAEDKCLMDVVIYDAYLVRALPLPVPFERLYVLPIETVLALAGNSFPRRYFDPEPGMYRDTRSFTAALRSRLRDLVFLDDGAQDEDGGFIFINTLTPQERQPQGGQPQEHQPQGGQGGVNCSGFAKWVVDGILRPHTGGRLPVAPLKAPFGERGTAFTDAWEEQRDPFFGLDWCRNLASRAWAALRSPPLGILEEIEVRHWPFSRLILRDNGGSSTRPYAGFLTNAGFGTEGLHPLLYTLAINEPGHIYLAAVNEETGTPATADNPRGLPRIRQYYHVAVLVPYFTAQGVFQVAVFESAEETSLTAFKNRYPGQFVNLTRIPIDGAFDP